MTKFSEEELDQLKHEAAIRVYRTYNVGENEHDARFLVSKGIEGMAAVVQQRLMDECPCDDSGYYIAKLPDSGDVEECWVKCSCQDRK